MEAKKIAFLKKDIITAKKQVRTVHNAASNYSSVARAKNPTKGFPKRRIATAKDISRLNSQKTLIKIPYTQIAETDYIGVQLNI